MKEKHVTSIRLQDLELLRNLSAIERRPMTEVLHKALVGYAISQGTGAKVPAKDIIPLYPKITEPLTTGATVQLAQVSRPAPHADTQHDYRPSSKKPKAQTRRRN